MGKTNSKDNAKTKNKRGDKPEDKPEDKHTMPVLRPRRPAPPPTDERLNVAATAVDDPALAPAREEGRYFVGVLRGFRHYFLVTSRSAANVVARRASLHAPGGVWIEGPNSASRRFRHSAQQLSGERAMAISHLTLEELNRLTPEQRQGFTHEQFAAALELLDPALRLTRTEQEQRAAAWMLADAAKWRSIAHSCIPHIVESYRRGDLDLRAALGAVNKAAIGCWVQDRLRLLGLVGEQALRTAPLKRARGQRSPKWPLWLQNATAGLVLEGQARSPELRRSPLPAYSGDDTVPEAEDGTSVPITWALDILTNIGWFGETGAPTQGTVDDWVRRWLREAVPPAASDPQS